MSLKDGGSCIPNKFMGSSADYSSAKIITVGAPMDYTCSYRPGTRFGPQRIRDVSYCLEEYSIYQDSDIRDVPFFDCGDLDLVPGDVSASLERIEHAVKEIYDDNKLPFFLGGEHLISLPLIHESYRRFGDELVLIHMDAHADLRESYLGIGNSHASVIRRTADFLPATNIYQFGIRSCTKDEIEFAKEKTNLYRYSVSEPLSRVIGNIKGKPVYVTLDIDVLDPAYANGTGTPEPGGISFIELMDAVLQLKELNLVGFDIVEVSPPYDNSDRTAVAAAKIMREALIMMAGSFSLH